MPIVGRVQKLQTAVSIWIIISLGPALRPMAGQVALAGDQCSVREEESFGVITGHFTVGLRTAYLVLPKAVSVYSPLIIFVQSPRQQSNANSAAQLYIESGGERAPMENGAIIRPPIRANTRLIFSVFDSRLPEPLCRWQPRVVFRNTPPPALTARLIDADPLDYLPIHRLGDAIFALAPAGVEPSEYFRIDGVAMPVLMQDGIAVYIRDTAPSVGLRTIQSPTHASPSLFVDVQVSPSRVELHPLTKSLTVSVTGLKDLRRPLHLALFNPNRDTLRLECGRDNLFFDDIKPDGYENKAILISPGKVRNERFETVCKIRVMKAGETGIWTYVAPDERALRVADGRRRF